MYLRPAIVGLLVPAVLIPLIVVRAKRDPEFAKAGDCIHNNNPIAAALPGVVDSNPDIDLVPCSDPKAEARVVGREDDTTDGENACRKYPTADGYFTSKHGSDKYTLCLQGLETPKQPKPTTIFGPVNP
ncbi:LppU/SCO3897 family protein [Kitasatospora sp. SC0581]|uniref:LppU/SCO3897 family protein n=1 Tax=Kitasatospora sp. SC0581 TaxID=3394360 RepID=UPI003A8BD9C2